MLHNRNWKSRESEFDLLLLVSVLSLVALLLSGCQKSSPEPVKPAQGARAELTPITPKAKDPLDDFLAPPLPLPSAAAQKPKLDFYYPHPFARYDDECQQYFVTVEFPYPEEETKALLAEIFSAYTPFLIVSATPKAKLEIQVGTSVGPESEGKTALLVQCSERLPCVAVAGILSVDDPPFSLFCKDSEGKAPEFKRTWLRKEILAAQTPGKPINDCARVVHCAAYEFEWGSMLCGRFSSSVLRECAAQSTCREVADCIEPYERAGDVKQRAAPRRRSSGDTQQQSSPAKPQKDWEF